MFLNLSGGVEFFNAALEQSIREGFRNGEMRPPILRDYISGTDSSADSGRLPAAGKPRSYFDSSAGEPLVTTASRRLRFPCPDVSPTTGDGSRCWIFEGSTATCRPAGPSA